MPRTSLIFGALVVYLAALLFQGYGYGIDDQIEIIPVLKSWLSGGDLYARDFYVSSYLDKGLTERSPFLYLLYYAAGVNPSVYFLIHAIISVLLFAGIIKVSEELTSSLTIGILAGLLLVTVGSYTSLGGNEIYYHYLIPSLPAKCIGIWALYYWLDHRSLSSSASLAVASYIQPLVGLQLFVILTISGLIVRRNYPKSALFVLIYGAIAGPWIILLLQQHGGAIDPAQYFEILEFRVGHHFFPEYFGVKNLIATLVLLSAILMIKGRSWRTVRMMAYVVAAICLIYAVIAQWQPLTTVINSQWFKTTIWIELFGIMAILSWFKDILHVDIERYALHLSFTAIVGLVLIQSMGLKQPQYGVPLGQIDTAEAKVAEWARGNTPQDAIFITPPTFNTFKILSERSCYVDFKAMIHHPDYMKEYYHRVSEIYGIDIEDRRQFGSSGMLEKAKGNMLSNIKTISEHADFLITDSRFHENGASPSPLVSIQGYHVYDLRRRN